jgi:hypothetical protein
MAGGELENLLNSHELKTMKQWGSNLKHICFLAAQMGEILKDEA